MPAFSQLARLRPSLGTIRWDGPKGGASPPGVLVDGAGFGTARPVGLALPEYPFENEGDKETVILRQRFCQRMSAYRPLEPGGTPSLLDPDVLEGGGFTVIGAYVGAQLYCIGESGHQDRGAGIGEWERAFASVPRERSVVESFSYALQYFLVQNGTPALRTRSVPIQSRVEYNYFELANLNAFPPLSKLEIVEVAEGVWRKRGEGDLRLEGSPFRVVVSNDEEIVAEDSTYGLWHFPIYFRRTRYVPGPKADLWGGESFAYTPA